MRVSFINFLTTNFIAASTILYTLPLKASPPVPPDEINVYRLKDKIYRQFIEEKYRERISVKDREKMPDAKDRSTKSRWKTHPALADGGGLNTMGGGMVGIVGNMGGMGGGFPENDFNTGTSTGTGTVTAATGPSQTTLNANQSLASAMSGTGSFVISVTGGGNFTGTFSNNVYTYMGPYGSGSVVISPTTSFQAMLQQMNVLQAQGASLQLYNATTLASISADANGGFNGLGTGTSTNTYTSIGNGSGVNPQANWPPPSSFGMNNVGGIAVGYPNPEEQIEIVEKFVNSLLDQLSKSPAHRILKKNRHLLSQIQLSNVQNIVSLSSTPLIRKFPSLILDSTLQADPSLGRIPLLLKHPSLLQSALVKKVPSVLKIPEYQTHPELLKNPFFNKYPEAAKLPSIVKNPELLTYDLLKMQPLLLAHPNIAEFMKSTDGLQNGIVDIYRHSKNTIFMRFTPSTSAPDPKFFNSNCIMHQPPRSYPPYDSMELICTGLEYLLGQDIPVQGTVRIGNPGNLNIAEAIPSDWSLMSPVDRFILKYSKPAPSKITVYRWGDAKYELEKTKTAIGKDKPAFEIETVNAGGGKMAGNGLYAAVDPTVSADYASGTDYAITEITIPKGTPVLDLVEDPELRQAMNREQMNDRYIYDSDLPIAVKYNWGTEPAWVIKTPHIGIKHFTGKRLPLSELHKHFEALRRLPNAANYYKARIQPELKKRVYIPGKPDIAPVDLRSCVPMDSWETHKKLSQFVDELSPILAKITSDPTTIKHYWRYDGSCGAYYEKDESPYLYKDNVDIKLCEKQFPLEIDWDDHGDCVLRVAGTPHTSMPIIVKEQKPEACAVKIQCLQDVAGEFYLQDVSRKHVRFPPGTQTPFRNGRSCQTSVTIAEETGMFCLPQSENRAMTVSTLSLIPTLPGSFSSLAACHRSLERADKKNTLYCRPVQADNKEPHAEVVTEKYSVVNYGNPYQEQVLTSGEGFQNRFDSQKSCQKALDSQKTVSHSHRDLIETTRNQLEVASQIKANGKINIAEFIKSFPYLKTLSERSAQVSEGYSVGEHSQLVLNQFEDQNRFYPLEDLEKKYPKMGDLKTLLRTTFLLHDIGKSLGNKKYQHAFTIPILVHYLKEWGFNQDQVNLAKELVNHDIIGEMLQGQGARANGTSSLLIAKARKLQMKPQDFFALQELFYVSDSSSYPYLNKTVFENKDGKLLIKPEYNDWTTLHTRMSKSNLED